MAIDINIPSQVKNYANLAGFPATGSLKTIFIAEDTNKTYRWTGSVYVEISGTDTSSLVPTSRTLTINGTTQDLSADRTFTISTGITIGTTAITSGVVGRVLFEGTGNVVQESANLFWDNTNGRLGVGGTPTSDLHIQKSGISVVKIQSTGNASRLDFSGSAYNNIQSNNDVPFYFDFYNTLNFRGNGGSVQALRIVGSTGNVLINTTTDAGFKLDVNGTARVVNEMTANNFNASNNGASYKIAGTAVMDYGDGLRFLNVSGSQKFTVFTASGTPRFQIVNSGSTLIGTTTEVASSLLTLQSTTRGFLPPRMTTTEKNAIASPATGLILYDTTLNLLALYNGTIWTTL